MIVPDTHIGRLTAWLRGWPRSRMFALVEAKDAGGHFYTRFAGHAPELAQLTTDIEAVLAAEGAELVEVDQFGPSSQRIPHGVACVQTLGRAYYAIEVSPQEQAREREDV